MLVTTSVWRLVLLETRLLKQELTQKVLQIMNILIKIQKNIIKFLNFRMCKNLVHFKMRMMGKTESHKHNLFH